MVENQNLFKESGVNESIKSDSMENDPIDPLNATSYFKNLESKEDQTFYHSVIETLQKNKSGKEYKFIKIQPNDSSALKLIKQFEILLYRLFDSPALPRIVIVQLIFIQIISDQGQWIFNETTPSFVDFKSNEKLTITDPFIQKKIQCPFESFLWFFNSIKLLDTPVLHDQETENIDKCYQIMHCIDPKFTLRSNIFNNQQSLLYAGKKVHFEISGLNILPQALQVQRENHTQEVNFWFGFRSFHYYFLTIKEIEVYLEYQANKTTQFLQYDQEFVIKEQIPKLKRTYQMRMYLTLPLTIMSSGMGLITFFVPSIVGWIMSFIILFLIILYITYFLWDNIKHHKLLSIGLIWNSYAINPSQILLLKPFFTQVDLQRLSYENGIQPEYTPNKESNCMRLVSEKSNNSPIQKNHQEKEDFPRSINFSVKDSIDLFLAD